MPDRVDLNRNLSLQQEDLRNHYVNITYNPYENAMAKSPAQNATYLRSIATGSSPKPKSTVATSAAATNQYLQRFKRSSDQYNSSAFHLSSAGGPLTQSTADRRQNML